MAEYHETFIQIVHASEYYDNAKGLVIEICEWDRSFGISSECRPFGDFQIGADRWSRGTPAFYNVKNALKYAKDQFGNCDIRVNIIRAA